MIQPASNAVEEKKKTKKREKERGGGECFSTEKEPVVLQDPNTLLSAKLAAN